MNSTTGDFTEIRKSIISDEIYNRGALSTAKKKSKRPMILRPLNLMDIKKEIEEELDDNHKQAIPCKENVNNEDRDHDKLTIIREEDVTFPEAPNNILLKDVTNNQGSQPLRTLFIDNENQPKSSLVLNLSSEASYRSEVKENTNLKQHKNDSFDLDFSALTLSTPVKQNDDNSNRSLNIIKPKPREHFQQFVTPKVNTSLSRNCGSRQFLKTPINSSNNSTIKKLVTPRIPEKVSPPSAQENQNEQRTEDKRSSSTFPNCPNDRIVTPSHGKSTKFRHTGLPSSNEEIQCPLRDDTFKRIKVNDAEYILFNLLGKGGSSEVYQCYNLERKLHVAIKCVSLQNPTCATGYINEVKLLQKLQNCDKIIKMYDYEILEAQNKLLVVLEVGGKDLSTILKQLASQQSHIPMYMLLFYWMDMLHAVKEIHSNGIIHSDLKPANFLRGDEGLKLIDFGIASSVQTDMTSVIKTKQEGSCNYISPEALNTDCTNFSNANTEKYKIHYKSDVWSLGCILYQFVYRRTPFQHITQLWPKLAAIMNPEHQIEYPAVDSVSPKIIGTIKKCLQYNVKLRPSVDELIAEYDQILHNI